MSKASTGVRILAMMLLCTLLTAIGQAFWKAGSDKVTGIQEFIFNYAVMLGFVLYAVASLFYIYALKKGKVSTVFPMMSLSFAWATIIGVSYLGETIKAANYLGIGLIILGVALLGWSEK